MIAVLTFKTSIFFNLTSTQEANVETHFPDVVGAEIFYHLTNTVELYVGRERMGSIAIDKEGSDTKNE